MSLSLYDTARRAVVPFSPLQPGRVAMYHCGPTVYSHAHVGNFRSFLLADLLRRHLEATGYDVHQVMNITDVGHLTVDDQADASGEDKLLTTARALGWDPYRVARHFEAAFHEDRRRLQFRDAHHYPRATEHVAEMLVLIQRLLDLGHAYIVDGEVYYDVSSFARYGALSGRSLDDQRAGARVEVNRAKRRPEDFALWKVDEGHLMQFDPHDPALWASFDRPPPPIDPALTSGFPGWHIECSAMSARYLGPSFDIHTGGEDNLFPHHECEVAQSEAAHGAPLARYWLHTRHLQVNGGKLSKRDGSAITVSDLADRGFEPRVVRFLLLSHHYRRPMNLTDEGLVAARAAVARLRAFRDAVRAVARPGRVSEAVQQQVHTLRAGWTDALDDDLDVPTAVGRLFGALRQWDPQHLDDAEAHAVLGALHHVDEVLGVFDEQVRSGTVPHTDLPAPSALDDALGRLTADDPCSIASVLAVRHRARAEQDWSGADRIRAALADAGIEVQDGPDHVRWTR